MDEQVKIKPITHSELLFSTLISLIQEASYILDTKIVPKIEGSLLGDVVDLQLTLSEIWDEATNKKEVVERWDR